VILWLNGAFGVGKSSVAALLVRCLPKAFLYDPEQVGYFLWDCFPDGMKRQGDFQHLPIWREFNYKILKHIAQGYDGVIVVPMTICVKRYYDEIIGALRRDAIEVKHFILAASKETILNRLAQRGEAADCWAAAQLDVCLRNFQTDIAGEMIDTDEMDVEGIVAKILLLTGW